MSSMWSSCRLFSPAMAFHNSGSASASVRERVNMAGSIERSGKRPFYHRQEPLAVGTGAGHAAKRIALIIRPPSCAGPFQDLRRSDDRALFRACREPATAAPTVGGRLNALLALSRAIDRLNERVGLTVSWL